MKKILMLCYKRPYPLMSGAEVRMFQFVEALSEYYAIDIVYVSNEKENYDKLHEICNDIKVFKNNKFARNIKAIKNFMLHGMPLQVGQLYCRSLVKWLNQHYMEYKIIVAFHIKMASYVMNLANTNVKNKIIFDGTDSITLQSYNSYKAIAGWKRYLYLIEYKKMKKYEKKVYETIPNTILISERDKTYITNNLKANCNPKVIYNYALDLGYKENIQKEDYSITFMGKMDYSPNVEAVTYFIEHIYNEIRKVYVKTQFHIIGGNVTENIKKYDGIYGIHVHGFVDDPAYYLQKSTVVIAPMRSGAGLQNKIVQAMYLGCVVITSRIGADGLINLSGNELVVYEDDNDLIDKLLCFLSDESSEKREILAVNAKNYIQENYSCQAIRKQILHVISTT